MGERELRERLAGNLAACRRAAGLTQAQLAERLHYSDKSISKWERGEGMPDVYILYELAELYGVTVNDLLGETPRREARPLRRRVLLTLLSMGLVWLVAVLAFLFCGLFCPGWERRWLVFLWALIPSCVLLLVFSCLWQWHGAWLGSVSALLWSVAVCVDVTLRTPNLYPIYIVAAVLQVLAVLWFIFRRNSRRKERKT